MRALAALRMVCARVRPRDVGFQDGGGARLVLLSRSFVPQ